MNQMPIFIKKNNNNVLVVRLVFGQALEAVGQLADVVRVRREEVHLPVVAQTAHRHASLLRENIFKLSSDLSDFPPTCESAQGKHIQNHLFIYTQHILCYNFYFTKKNAYTIRCMNLLSISFCRSIKTKINITTTLINLNAILK